MSDEQTVYLGQFTDENAERLTGALADAGIPFWAKSSGRLIRAISMQDWGVRLLVPAEHLDAARAIAMEIAPDGLA